MITEAEKRKEKDYLKTVLYILEKNLQNNTEDYQKNSESIRKQLKYMWEENIADPYEYYNLKQIIESKNMFGDSLNLSIKTQKRMVESAYFARIDFDDGDENFPVYIGIASLIDGGHFYVYDWRAPISSMFYDFELGDGEYTLPNGNKVKGKITLKRQYKIEGDQIIEIFDTELQVIDTILQKMLSGNATSRMKSIVKSIQAEQNSIIRKRNVDILVVQGPAGSGKTSVAMHRIAYLLYAEKETLKNSNILIISPNEVFSSYISGVLPEVGEENVYQTTYKDYIRSFVKEFKVKGDMSDVYEELFTENRKSVFFNSIQLKFAMVYFNVIETWLLKNRAELLGLSDVVVDGNVLINKEFLEKFASTLDPSLSIIQQADQINDKIISHLDIKLHKDPKTKSKIVKSLKMRIDKIRTRNLYLSLYEDQDIFIGEVERAYNEFGTRREERLSIKELKEIFDYTQMHLKKEIMPYEDVLSYLYLKGRIRGFTPQVKIKHVVIDEAQDYTTLQYNLVSKMFPTAKFTLLGDVNQAIMPMAQHRNYDTIVNMMTRKRPKAKTETAYLSKTYRSTYEINTFAKNLLSDKIGIKQVERHGDKVQIIEELGNLTESKIFDDALKIKKKYQAVAIICKTERELLAVKKALETIKKAEKFAFMTKDADDYTTEKVIIIPSYLAKGLEFDAVLVFGATEENYSAQYANLFYVVCTRALHKLSIYHNGNLCKQAVLAIKDSEEVVQVKKYEAAPVGAEPKAKANPKQKLKKEKVIPKPKKENIKKVNIKGETK